MVLMLDLLTSRVRDEAGGTQRAGAARERRRRTGRIGERQSACTGGNVVGLSTLILKCFAQQLYPQRRVFPSCRRRCCSDTHSRARSSASGDPAVAWGHTCPRLPHLPLRCRSRSRRPPPVSSLTQHLPGSWRQLAPHATVAAAVRQVVQQVAYCLQGSRREPEEVVLATRG